MEFGDEWGELFGDTEVDETVVASGLARFTSKLNGPRLRDLATLVLDRIQALERITGGLSPDLTLRAETGYGYQLENVGAIINHPVQLKTKEEFALQASVASNSLLRRRSIEDLLVAARTLIGPTPPIGYTEYYPRSFVLDLTIDTEAEARNLVEQLRYHRPATYNGFLVLTLPTAFEFDDASGVVPTTTDGFSDSSGAVAGGAPLGFLAVL